MPIGRRANQLLHRRPARDRPGRRGSSPTALNEMGRATPFLVTDCDVVASRLDAFVQAMPGIRPYFALKCNAAQPVLATLAERGCGVRDRIGVRAGPPRAVGVDARDVLFSNTVKPEPHIREAALRGVWRFALDSEGELLKIAAAAPGSAIYVRLNVEDSHSLFPLSRKFGTSADEALRLLRMAPECGLRPYGLTFHVGSQCTDPSMYARAIERCGLVMRRLEQFGTRIEMLNIGGGMPATYSEPVPDIRAVGDAVGRGPRPPAVPPGAARRRARSVPRRREQRARGDGHRCRRSRWRPVGVPRRRWIQRADGGAADRRPLAVPDPDVAARRHDAPTGALQRDRAVVRQQRHDVLRRRAARDARGRRSPLHRLDRRLHAELRLARSTASRRRRRSSCRTPCSAP